MSGWLLPVLLGIVLLILLVFLSASLQKKVLRITIMFALTFLAIIAFGYGVFNAAQEAKKNLGKPLQEIEEGTYKIFWVSISSDGKKVYLVADKDDEQGIFDLRYYQIKPSDDFLDRLRKLLKEKQKITLRVGSDEDEETFDIHPAPPEPLPPKTES